MAFLGHDLNYYLTTHKNEDSYLVRFLLEFDFCTGFFEL